MTERSPPSRTHDGAAIRDLASPGRDARRRRALLVPVERGGARAPAPAVASARRTGSPRRSRRPSRPRRTSARRKGQADKRAEEKRAKAEKRAERTSAEARSPAASGGTAACRNGRPATGRRGPQSRPGSALADPGPSAAPPPGRRASPSGTRDDDTVADFNAGRPGVPDRRAHRRRRRRGHPAADGARGVQRAARRLAGRSSHGRPAARPTFAAGQIHVDGARVNTTALYAPPRTLEFKATFRPLSVAARSASARR